MKISSEAAESWPFGRTRIAELVDVPVRRLNNWIDRNELWQHGRAGIQHGYYRLADVFDLAGFGALRAAGVPERRAAQYTRNFGFYRHFLGGDQLANFSYRNGQWDIGVYDPSAIVSLIINMRSLGAGIFGRLSKGLAPVDGRQPTEAFLQFQSYYHRLVEMDCLPKGSAPEFEIVPQ